MRTKTVLTKLNAWRPQVLQKRLPLLADSTASRESISMNRPADQIALLGTRIHRAIRAAAAGTTNDWALDAVLAQIFARPPVSRMQVEELLGPEVVDELVAQEPAFRTILFRLYGERIADLMGLVEAIAFQKLDQRLARLLVERGPRVSATHQSLADELGVAREMVSRVLRNFADRGLIAQHREVILVADPGALEQQAA